VHAATNAETNAYLVEKLTNDDTLVVSDLATGQKCRLRLAVLMVAGNTPADLSHGFGSRLRLRAAAPFERRGTARRLRRIEPHKRRTNNVGVPGCFTFPSG
jgi:hypothetical protein